MKVWRVEEGADEWRSSMPKPYSHDLRSRALEACDEGERPDSVAKRFRVGRAKAERMKVWRV